MTERGVFVTIGSSNVAGNPIKSGVTFAFGVSPINKASDPATPGIPVICRTFSEFERKFGYSEDWETYNLCEVAYTLFHVFKIQPVIFCNLLDPATNNESVASASVNLVSHRAELPESAINDSNLVVKATSSGSALTLDTDYRVFYANDKCYVEALSGGSAASATSLYIAYKKIKPSAITAATYVANVDGLEYCTGSLGLIPDIVIAPGISGTSAVAAALAEKVSAISEMFRARVLIDLDCTTATTVSAAVSKKASDNLTSEREIVLWPMAKKGDKMYHLSVEEAGVIARTDAENGGYPDVSPSNKEIDIDTLCLADGTPVNLMRSDANALEGAGICTALNSVGKYRTRGIYTAAYPASSEPHESEISVARFFDYAVNYVTRTLEERLDSPMNRRQIDSIITDLKAWMNGLTGTHILSGSVDFYDDNNPTEALMNGIISINMAMEPPRSIGRINVDIRYVATAVSSIL